MNRTLEWNGSEGDLLHLTFVAQRHCPENRRTIRDGCTCVLHRFISTQEGLDTFAELALRRAVLIQSEYSTTRTRRHDDD